MMVVDVVVMQWCSGTALQLVISSTKESRKCFQCLCNGLCGVSPEREGRSKSLANNGTDSKAKHTDTHLSTVLLNSSNCCCVAVT